MALQRGDRSGRGDGAGEQTQPEHGDAPHAGRAQVPVRTIAAAIGMVLVAAAGVWLVIHLSRVLVWMVVAIFFAVVLSPMTGFLQRRVRLPRPLATLAALLALFAALGGAITVLIRPLIEQGRVAINQLPGVVSRAQRGEGPIGSLIRRYDVAGLISQNQDRLQRWLAQMGDPALNALVTAGNVVIGIVVVLVLSFLFTLEGPRLASRFVAMLPERHRGRASRVFRQSGRAVTGYVTGQLLIATLYGTFTYLVLALLDVPFAGVVALFVGLAGLVPAIGATIGGVLAIGVAFLHTITAGIVVLIFVVVYQQIENHLVQPIIQARTVHLHALAVIVSVLIGVELAGILGALLAIPAAGIVKILAQEFLPNQFGRLESTGQGSGARQTGVDSASRAAPDSPDFGAGPGESGRPADVGGAAAGSRGATPAESGNPAGPEPGDSGAEPAPPGDGRNRHGRSTSENME